MIDPRETQNQCACHSSNRFSHHIGKNKDSLVIYDPYFCQGSIRAAFQRLGFKNIIHEARLTNPGV